MNLRMTLKEGDRLEIMRRHERKEITLVNLWKKALGIGQIKSIGNLFCRFKVILVDKI